MEKGEEALCSYRGSVRFWRSSSYLGVSMHCSASFGSFAAALRKVSGRKALHCTRRKMASLKLSAPDIQCRLFDIMVDPVLSYGAEIWAPELLCKEDPCNTPCEKSAFSIY